LPHDIPTLIARFEGERGKTLLLEELRNAKIVNGAFDLAEALANAGVLQPVMNGQTLIEQNDSDNDIYFIYFLECARRHRAGSRPKSGPRS
jgi:hypothetical protein